MERGEVLFRERQGVKKKIRGRQAGGLGSELVHVREREGERARQRESSRMCVIYVCVCVFVHTSVCVCALALFLSFLCLTTEWGKKARQNIER